MQFKQKFDQISNFLTSYKAIWENEILPFYPRPEVNYNSDWIDYLFSLSTDKVYEIDGEKKIDQVDHPEFRHYLTEIRRLGHLPSTRPKSLSLPKNAYFQIKYKKFHEFETLLAFIDEEYKNDRFEHLTDIGGGAGHFCRILTHYLNIPSIILDQDKELLERGRKRCLRYSPNGPNPEYRHVYFSQLNDDNKDVINKSLGGNRFSMGLHTCGPLSNHHISNSIKLNSKRLLNFGCCYHKLPIGHHALSSLGKEHSLYYTQAALTLASRSHGHMERKDFDFKMRVKQFRYSFHILLHDLFDIREFVSLGNSSLRLYSSSFGEYAIEQFRRLNIDPKMSSSALDAFYAEKKIKDTVHRMFLCNLIRQPLGRPLELTILLDRCLYLQENGYNVRMTQFFNENISPRNIGIHATLN